jgi:hypothetical protein
MKKTTTRISLVEAVALVAVVGFFAYAFGHQRGVLLERASGAWRSPDDVQLEATWAKRYKTRHSAHLEEWAARDFFHDMRGGVFADIGAWEWENDNNTLALERELGWSGLAVDAVADHAPGWRQNRPRSRFVVAFVDRVDGQPRTLDVPVLSTQLASAPDNTAMHDMEAYEAQTRQTYTQSATLDTLLAGAGITHLDFLSMDIELHEPAALAGFSIDRFKPGLVCIEAHHQVRQQILNYFHQHGYVLVGKYLRNDSTNLWFMPAP